MNKKVLIGGLCAALLAVAACGGSTTKPAANNSNTTAATPAPTTASSASSPAASNAAAQDFTLVNATGVEIDKVFISPHDKNDWEEDILGKDTLASGESVKITFDDHDKHVHWDLKVTDKDGNALEWYDLNLIEIDEVTLHWDAAKGKGWADIK